MTTPTGVRGKRDSISMRVVPRGVARVPFDGSDQVGGNGVVRLSLKPAFADLVSEARRIFRGVWT